MAESKPKVYRYKVSSRGTVSTEVWDAMTLNERLDKFKEVLGLKHDVEVAATLAISVNSVRKYRTGVRHPGTDVLAKIASICIEDKQAPLKEFMAANTIAVDPSLDVFEKAFSGNSLLALNMSCYALAIKFAATADKVIDDTVVVPQVTTCYGTTPAYAVVKLTSPGTDAWAEVKVTYTLAPVREYIARVNLRKSDALKQVFAYTMSDKAVMEILLKIGRHIKAYGPRRRKVTKRATECKRRKSSESKGS